MASEDSIKIEANSDLLSYEEGVGKKISEFPDIESAPAGEDLLLLESEGEPYAASLSNLPMFSAMSAELGKKAPKGHTHTKADITNFPTSLAASDVYAWAKVDLASFKSNYKNGNGITSTPAASSHSHSAYAFAEGGTSSAGYIQFPTGIKIVWGGYSLSGTSEVGVSLYSAFSSTSYNVQVTGNARTNHYATPSTTTTFRARQESSSSYSYSYLAIGY